MSFQKVSYILQSKLEIVGVANKLRDQANDGKFIILGKINSSG